MLFGVVLPLVLVLPFVLVLELVTRGVEQVVDKLPELENSHCCLSTPAWALFGKL